MPLNKNREVKVCLRWDKLWWLTLIDGFFFKMKKRMYHNFQDTMCRYTLGAQGGQLPVAMICTCMAFSTDRDLHRHAQSMASSLQHQIQIQRWDDLGRVACRPPKSHSTYASSFPCHLAVAHPTVAVACGLKGKWSICPTVAWATILSDNEPVCEVSHVLHTRLFAVSEIHLVFV